MTDRELLELAAKAAEIDGGNGCHIVREGGDGRIRDWNPLTDDGDAMRLALKIGSIVDMRYSNQNGSKEVRVNYWLHKEGHKPFSTVSECSEDYLSATRRAIVRAAAEIGGSL